MQPSRRPRPMDNLHSEASPLRQRFDDATASWTKWANENKPALRVARVGCAVTCVAALVVLARHSRLAGRFTAADRIPVSLFQRRSRLKGVVKSAASPENAGHLAFVHLNPLARLFRYADVPDHGELRIRLAGVELQPGTPEWLRAMLESHAAVGTLQLHDHARGAVVGRLWMRRRFGIRQHDVGSMLVRDGMATPCDLPFPTAKNPEAYFARRAVQADMEYARQLLADMEAAKADGNGMWEADTPTPTPSFWRRVASWFGA